MRVILRQAFEPRPAAAPRADVAVLFDVFRASTTVAALLAAPAREIVATNDPARAERLVGTGYRLVSEVFSGGLDNSPIQVLGADLADRRVVHKSTNLTTALFQVLPGATRVLIGGFVSMSRLIEILVASGAEVVELVAAGHVAERREAVEDTACLKMAAARLSTLGAVSADPSDRAGAIPDRERIDAYLADKRARLAVSSTHYWQDVALALTVDALPFVAEAKAKSDGTIGLAPVS